jgi:hypothetical protein
MSLVTTALVRNVMAPRPCPELPAGAPPEVPGACQFWRDYANLPQYATPALKRPAQLELPKHEPNWLERGRDAVVDFLTDLVQ